MQERKMVCIVCPVGCQLTVTQDHQNNVTVQGNSCKRGITYGTQELLQPMRTVTTSVWVQGGAQPLCPVKTADAVPKANIDKVLKAIHEVVACAPIKLGDVLLQNAAGTGVDIVATANVLVEQP